MAKKQTVVVPLQPDANEALDLTEIVSADALNPALEAIFAEMGQDELGKIKVYISKLIEDTGKEARVWEGPPSDYDLMATARRFGSGDYRVKVYVPHESGRVVIRGNQVFPILLDPAEDAKIIAMRSGAPASAAIAAPAQPAFNPETLIAAIISGIKAAMPAPVDTLAQMDKLAGVMAKLMPQAQPVKDGSSFTEILAASKSLIELTKSVSPPIDGEGRVDAKGLALARGIDLVGKMFEKSLEQAKSNPSAAAAQLPAPAAPANVEQPAAAQDQLTQEQREELEMIRLQIRMVNRQAAANADPAKFAEEYYDQLPDAVFDALLFEPGWFNMLVSNVPECAQYKDWYERVRLAIIGIAVKEGDVKANPDGSLTPVTDSDTTQAHGNPDAGNAAASGG